LFTPPCRFPEEGSGEAVPAAEVHQQARSQEAGRETGIKGLSGEISYIFAPLQYYDDSLIYKL